MATPALPLFQVWLGRAVRARRLELELTQEELALRSGLHQRWISNVETGRRNPSYGSLRRLSQALELDASVLIANAERIERAQSTAPAMRASTSSGGR